MTDYHIYYVAELNDLTGVFFGLGCDQCGFYNCSRNLLVNIFIVPVYIYIG